MSWSYGKFYMHRISYVAIENYENSIIDVI